MCYVIKLENRPDGIINSTTASVALTVMDNNGEIIENKLIPTAYVPTEAEG